MKAIRHKHVTKFNGLNIESSTNSFISYIANILNILLNKIGVKIVRYRSDIDHTSEFFSFHTNNQLNNYRAIRIKEALYPLTSMSEKFDNNSMIDLINEYFDLIKESPIKIDGGGVGVLNGLKLFISVKILKPSTIIESGVWRGFTTFIFDHASSKDTNIFSYDINLDPLLYKGSNKVRFIEDDWFEKTKKIKFQADSTLCFFDDHVSHVQRITEANQLGIKHVIVDDNYPLEQIYVDGWPPIPTVDMCFNNAFRELQSLSWVKNGINYYGNWAAGDLEECRKLVKNKIDYPSLYDECGYQPGSKMSYIELK